MMLFHLFDPVHSIAFILNAFIMGYFGQFLNL